ncbi:MAG: ATP-binding cassette domain-containing protein, partial [Anaerolineae bacterium]
MKEAPICRGSVASSEEYLLEAREVDFSYYDGLVIKSVNLGLKQGDIVGLIGPNGSGKTTLLRLLSGFLPPKSGRVCLSGRDLGQMSRRDIARLIAVVPQELEMLFSFSVWEM